MKTIVIECESIEDDTFGVGRIVLNLLEELSRRPELANEFKFVLYFKSRIPDFPFLQSPLFEKKLLRLPLFRPSFSLYYYVLLPLVSWFKKADIAFFPNYMLPIGFRGKSLVILTDDVYAEARNSQLPFRYRIAYRIYCGWAARKATRIMTISETSQKEVARLFGIAPYRILVNYLGVDAPKPEEVKSYKLKAKRSYLLYVGQAFPRRHLKECLEAFEQIAPEYPELMFIAVGPDKYPRVDGYSFIKHMVREINQRLGGRRIFYRERVEQSELDELYSAAKALLYVSSREAFGLPPLEALARGTVPVIADALISHELFGDAAFFVANPGSADSIAEMLKRVLSDEDKQKAILTKGVEVVSRFTWKVHADRFLQIVRSL